MPLVTMLSQGLSKTIDAVERFFTDHANIFNDLAEQGPGYRSLHAMKTILDELRWHRQTLKHLKEGCDQFPQKVSSEL